MAISSPNGDSSTDRVSSTLRRFIDRYFRRKVPASVLSTSIGSDDVYRKLEPEITIQFFPSGAKSRMRAREFVLALSEPPVRGKRP